jgi:diguanylate cyclase (GGDEF)-like protein
MAVKDARILIADDDSISLYLLCDLFSDGFVVSCVRSGEEALNTVLSFRPDILILDIVMKGMDGFEVCERLKANKETADIPVVFISSRDDIESEVAGLKAGGIDFITKPFNPAVVRMRIINYIELKKNRDNLEMMSITDQLTGLFNRRYFDRMVNAEVRRSSRNQGSLALMMADVDDFKKYNDTNGHLAGDECLKLICSTLKKEFRRVGDLVARYGGEEMAILLPSTSLDSANLLAENARRSIEELQIAFDGLPEHGIVTISIGIAAVVPEAGADPLRIINCADKALYLAKTGGRNRVVAAQ